MTLFEKFMLLKHEIQNLAGIVQNEGLEISKDDLDKWNSAACKCQMDFTNLIAEVNELYQ